MSLLYISENIPAYNATVIPDLKEIALQKVWERIPLMHPFRLVDTETLLVIHPGTLNDGVGPDFKNAQLLIDGEIIFGDVECHLKSREWYYHGHDNDARYNNIVLHVVEHENNGPDLPTLILTSRHTPCIARTHLDASMLSRFAYKRIVTKTRQLEAKFLHGIRLSAHDYGLIETIVNGAHKNKIIKMLVHEFGWGYWPQKIIWKGSSQSYRKDLQIYSFARDILSQLLERSIDTKSWDLAQQYLKSLGISKVYIREYYSNIWIPQLDISIEGKWILWSNLDVARHYGFENKMKRWGVIDTVNTIMEQQGLLYFYQKFCKRGNCQNCPIVGGR